MKRIEALDGREEKISLVYFSRMSALGTIYKLKCVKRVVVMEQNEDEDEDEDEEEERD
ncbi:hypothetical protein Csa_008135 [Cucumis sativus]|uniref:Uncharacterized protein n=1 Tax=Cucumis sativus TaxID=3659 RepID=A0A0A0KUQ6_CUCSA|nr:hypothetical protein Csa_008135 [Cucumis sativus]